MVNEKLVNDIMSKLKQGHDLVEQGETLFSLGYSAREIHDAIDYVIGDMRTEEKRAEQRQAPGHSKFELISFSFPRIILPIIVFIVLMVQIFFNYGSIPSIAADRCKVAEITAQIEQLNVSDDLDAAKKEILPLQVSIWNIDRDNIDLTRSTMITNFPIYFLRLNWIDPIFPVPCERVFFEQSDNCRFYSDRASYDCLSAYGDKSFVPVDIEYAKVSALGIIINFVIILLEVYIINSLLAFLWKSIKEHTTKKAKQVIEMMIVFAIIALLFAIIYGILESLRAIAG